MKNTASRTVGAISMAPCADDLEDDKFLKQFARVLQPAELHDVCRFIIAFLTLRFAATPAGHALTTLLEKLRNATRTRADGWSSWNVAIAVMRCMHKHSLCPSLSSAHQRPRILSPDAATLHHIIMRSKSTHTFVAGPAPSGTSSQRWPASISEAGSTGWMATWPRLSIALAGELHSWMCQTCYDRSQKD